MKLNNPHFRLTPEEWKEWMDSPVTKFFRLYCNSKLEAAQKALGQYQSDPRHYDVAVGTIAAMKAFGPHGWDHIKLLSFTDPEEMVD